jgi:hypothetical protein
MRAWPGPSLWRLGGSNVQVRTGSAPVGRGRRWPKSFPKLLRHQGGLPQHARLVVPARARAPRTLQLKAAWPDPDPGRPKPDSEDDSVLARRPGGHPIRVGPTSVAAATDGATARRSGAAEERFARGTRPPDRDRPGPAWPGPARPGPLAEGRRHEVSQCAGICCCQVDPFRGGRRSRAGIKSIDEQTSVDSVAVMSMHFQSASERLRLHRTGSLSLSTDDATAARAAAEGRWLAYVD